MYTLHSANDKAEKKLKEYISRRNDIPRKLERLLENPRKECGAHPLKGPLEGKWAAWLGSNIRIIYLIDDVNKKVTILSVGTHKLY